MSERLLFFAGATVIVFLVVWFGISMVQRGQEAQQEMAIGQIELANIRCAEWLTIGKLVDIYMPKGLNDNFQAIGAGCIDADDCRTKCVRLIRILEICTPGNVNFGMACVYGDKTHIRFGLEGS